MKLNKVCRVCLNKNTKKVWKLNSTPMEDDFVKKKINQKKYPLELYLCEKCKHVFLPHILSPVRSYKYYLYNTEVTLGLVKHYKDYAKELIKKLKIKKKSFCVDIGSNDGSMLRAFKSFGMNIAGVEPGVALFKKANRNKLLTYNSFFEQKIVKKILKIHGPADVITANYVFANIDNLNQFIINAKKLLSENGVLVIQTGYYPDQFKKKMFDYIYHEHFSYFSIHSLKFLFKKHNMYISQIVRKNPKGGSVRVFVRKNLKNNKTSDYKIVKNFLKYEKKIRACTSSYFTKLEKTINKMKHQLLKYLNSNNLKNLKMAGFGASHSTTILLHHFDLNKYINLIVDDNPLKHGLFSPGFHIPVKKTNYLLKKKYKNILILAWQHQDAIIKKHNNLLKMGMQFVVPLPRFKVVKNEK